MSYAKESLRPPLWIIVALVFALFIWVMIQLKELVVLLVIGFCIAYIIEPVISFFERRKISRNIGAPLLLFIFVIFLLFLFFTTLPTILNEYHDLSKNLPIYVQTAKLRLTELSSTIQERYPNLPLPIEDWIAHPMEKLSAYSDNILPKVQEALSATLLTGYSLALTLINLTLLPFIVFYLSIDFHSLWPKFLAVFPSKYQDKINNIGLEINGYVSAFVRGQFTICTILFLLYSLSLAIIGIKLWLIVAIIAGFGNMIPYLGFVLGIGLASIMALVTYGTFSKLVIVWVAFACVQFLEGTFITPKILGDKIGLSPLAIILALLAGGTLFGLLGIFLAVPGAAIIRVISNHFREWLLTTGKLKI